MIASPTIVSALIGGALIGTSASMLLMLSGRVAGISGIVGGLFDSSSSSSADDDDSRKDWRVAFLVGLLLGGVVLAIVRPEVFATTTSSSPLLIATAGVFVGVGTALGNGCTSGHGVCGISRFSKRSIVATCLFMATAMAIAFLTEHVFQWMSR